MKSTLEKELKDLKLLERNQTTSKLVKFARPRCFGVVQGGCKKLPPPRRPPALHICGAFPGPNKAPRLVQQAVSPQRGGLSRARGCSEMEDDVCTVAHTSAIPPLLLAARAPGVPRYSRRAAERRSTGWRRAGVVRKAELVAWESWNGTERSSKTSTSHGLVRRRLCKQVSCKAGGGRCTPFAGSCYSFRIELAQDSRIAAQT